MRSNLSVLGVLLLLSTAQAGSYTVQKNDTLYSLSKRFGLSVEELMKLNHLEEPKLTLGQVIQVPDAKAGPVSAPITTHPKEHVVAKQETLFGIARKYGLSMEDLKRWNGLTGNDLDIGQVLKLSAPPEKVAAPVKPEVKVTNTKPVPPAKTETKSEVKPEPKSPVTPADAKTTRAEPAKTEVKTTPVVKPEVKAEVKVETKTEVRTETVKSPVKPVETVKTEPVKTTPEVAQAPVKAVKVKPVLNNPTLYTVEKGDNLYNLARRFGVTVDDLMTWNALEKSALDVGQTLQLIAKIQPAPESAVAAKQPEVKPEAKTEIKAEVKAEPVPVKVMSTVKPSAEQEKVTVKPVQVVENATTITPVIDPEHHTVQRGDTLSALARKYSTTVGALQEANGLTDTDLKVGQVLILPSTLKNIPQPSNLVNIVSTNPNPWRDYAMSLLNLPYIYGGNDPLRGLDCSSFTLLVMQQAGVRLPRTSMEQSQVGQPIDRQEMQEGDLIFFDTLGHGVSHVGIYLGDNQFIHANSYLERVSIDDVTNTYYARRVVGVRRVLSPLTASKR
ncbi:LysM peptidoglycan-binding domain-containing protein [Deinococcus cellulosilyticus]|uniref:Peptidoglycan endopeptidase n=1 Tax=Deinococcus cellulosilyticus (strain DSM 18568 / NBRC 106333 / KACC 11606 / 5516J-15) TaxID=1223518 RepID=A0A511MX53_DEIC1|nr:LysM peptidoglycan-binding domain-containing protein [Deinococcus cellulosilyticus]GEM45163.1 hypothetical protein DC3_07980 [Deinococcus cellulosilyticus NBRC 106333 = KACC 11606]